MIKASTIDAKPNTAMNGANKRRRRDHSDVMQNRPAVSQTAERPYDTQVLATSDDNYASFSRDKRRDKS